MGNKEVEGEEVRKERKGRRRGKGIIRGDEKREE